MWYGLPPVWPTTNWTFGKRANINDLKSTCYKSTTIHIHISKVITSNNKIIMNIISKKTSHVPLLKISALIFPPASSPSSPAASPSSLPFFPLPFLPFAPSSSPWCPECFLPLPAMVFAWLESAPVESESWGKNNLVIKKKEEKLNPQPLQGCSWHHHITKRNSIAIKCKSFKLESVYSSIRISSLHKPPSHTTWGS